MPTRKKVTDLWTVTRNGPDTSNCGHATCTFGPTGCVAAPHTLRNEGERPTGCAEAMAAAVARRGRAHGVWRAISVANIDRKVTYFYLKIKGSIYLGNQMETCKSPRYTQWVVRPHS